MCSDCVVTSDAIVTGLYCWLSRLCSDCVVTSHAIVTSLYCWLSRLCSDCVVTSHVICGQFVLLLVDLKEVNLNQEIDWYILISKLFLEQSAKRVNCAIKPFLTINKSIKKGMLSVSLYKRNFCSKPLKKFLKRFFSLAVKLCNNNMQEKPKTCLSWSKHNWR